MQTNESWKFSGALYVSEGNGATGFLPICGIITSIFAIVGIFAYVDSISIDGHETEITIFGIIFVLGVILAIIAGKRNSKLAKKIYLAVFNDHMTILPINKQPKGSVYDHRDPSGYLQIKYTEITKYTFIHYYSTDEDSIFRDYYNYGELKIETQTSQYRTQVKDIESAQKLLWSLIPIPETMEMWQGQPVRYPK